jgi:hypothetical protein
VKYSPKIQSVVQKIRRSGQENHPSFARANVFRQEICNSIETNYPADMTILTEHNLSEKYIAPEVYLNRCKLNAKYSNNDGTKTPIATKAFVMYANADDFLRSMTLLTQVSTLRNPTKTDEPFFIPLALKFQNPAKFGSYVSKQNAFLN